MLLWPVWPPWTSRSIDQGLFRLGHGNCGQSWRPSQVGSHSSLQWRGKRGWSKCILGVLQEMFFSSEGFGLANKNISMSRAKIYCRMFCPKIFSVPRSDDTMSHLGAFVPQVSSFDARICGTWEGTTSEALGGYVQTIEFQTDCLNAKITVMGQTLGLTFQSWKPVPARVDFFPLDLFTGFFLCLSLTSKLRTLPAQFHMNCSVEPKQLNIQVMPKNDGQPPPAIPYIFEQLSRMKHPKQSGWSSCCDW